MHNTERLEKVKDLENSIKKNYEQGVRDAFDFAWRAVQQIVQDSKYFEDAIQKFLSDHNRQSLRSI